MQRLTAAANVIAAHRADRDCGDAGRPQPRRRRRDLSRPLVAILLIAAIVSVSIHMRIGMQIVIEDYVHSPFRKIVLLMLNTFFSFGVGLVCTFAVLKICFRL